MALNGRDVPKPHLPKETVEVPEMGGEVIIRALTLSESINLSIEDGEEGDDEKAKTARITKMLAMCVVNDDGSAFWSQTDWENYGATHDGRFVCVRLANKINDLIGGSTGKSKSQETSA